MLKVSLQPEGPWQGHTGSGECHSAFYSHSGVIILGIFYFCQNPKCVEIVLDI